MCYVPWSFAVFIATCSFFCCFIHTPGDGRTVNNTLINRITSRDVTLVTTCWRLTSSGGVVQHASVGTNELLQQFHILQDKIFIFGSPQCKRRNGFFETDTDFREDFTDLVISESLNEVYFLNFSYDLYVKMSDKCILKFSRVEVLGNLIKYKLFRCFQAKN